MITPENFETYDIGRVESIHIELEVLEQGEYSGGIPVVYDFACDIPVEDIPVIDKRI